MAGVVTGSCLEGAARGWDGGEGDPPAELQVACLGWSIIHGLHTTQDSAKTISQGFSHSVQTATLHAFNVEQELVVCPQVTYHDLEVCDM